MRRARSALLAIPVAVLLAGCVGGPAPEPTPITLSQACTALEGAVVEYYETVSPGSTVEELVPHELPDVNGFRIPTPNCAFEVRPDATVTPGDVFTIESFYLDYHEDLTVSLPTALEAAGFVRRDAELDTWSAAKLGRSYSAALLVFAPGDGSPFSEAAEHFRVLDLSVGKT